MDINKTDYYDFNDLNFGWRGRYRVLKQDPESGLVYIENLGTKSRQFVSVDRLRKSKCNQFYLRSLSSER